MNKTNMMKLSAFCAVMSAVTGCVMPQAQQRTVVIERNPDGTTTTNVVENAQQPSTMASIGNGIVGFFDGVEATTSRYQNTIGTTLGIANTVNGFRQTSALQHIASGVKSNAQATRAQTKAIKDQNNFLQTFLQSNSGNSCSK